MHVARLCRRSLARSPPLSLAHPPLSLAPPSSRSIGTVNFPYDPLEPIAGDEFGPGGNLDSFGTFPEMEEYLVDYIPEITVNVVSALPELTLWNSSPTMLIAHSMDTLQCLTGLSWAATIGITAVVVKSALYPCHVWWRREFQEWVKESPPQIATFLRTYFSEVLRVGSEEALASAYAARARLCAEGNFMAYPNLIPIYATTLVPLSFLIGVSYLSGLTYEPLITGGALWFPDLHVPDPYFLLPSLNSALIVAICRYHPFGLLLPKPVFGFKAPIQFALLTMVTGWCSSGLLLYCISANSVGLVVQLLLRTRAVREVHGLEAKVTVLRPMIEHGKEFGKLGLQIGETRTRYIAAQDERFLLAEEGVRKALQKEKELDKPKDKLSKKSLEG